MHYIFLLIMLGLAFFFTVIAYMSKNILFKVIAGSLFIFIGFMLITGGLEIPNGSVITAIP